MIARKKAFVDRDVSTFSFSYDKMAISSFKKHANGVKASNF